MVSEAAFIPGLKLNEMFHHEVVGSLLSTHFPDVAYSAALTGYGSDVLGFDTPMSMDHNWGPRLQLFLSPADYEKYRADIDELLQQKLPVSFRGFPVNFAKPAPTDGVQWMVAVETGPVNHLIEIYTIRSFFERYLELDPYADLQPLDWLRLPEQGLLEVTAGKVYHDGLNELKKIRTRFTYYPRDIWLYRLASQWQRISQEEAFMGRCGDIGDELGSKIVAARLVRDLIRLAFLLERQYAPYSKWLGTAFARLRCGPELIPIFNRVLETTPWTARQEPLCEAYIILAKMQNSLGLTPPVEPRITDYHERPYRVIFAGRFAEAIKEAISDESIKKIPADIGGIDQFADCVDLTDYPQLAKRLRVLYE